MIVIQNRLKIYAIITAVILIPLLCITVFKRDAGLKSQPVDKTVVESEDEKRAVQDKSLQLEDDFFSEYRMERERVRSKEIVMLREIVNNPASVQKAREAAYIKLVDLADREEKEMQAEAMVRSQGFQDCAVVITPKNTTVMLEGDSPGTADQEEIRKAVSIATGSMDKTISVVNLQHYQK